MMRGSSLVLLLLGFASAMISACGGESGKKPGSAAEGGDSSGDPGAPTDGGEASGGSTSTGELGGRNGTSGGSAGRIGVGGNLGTAGFGGMRPSAGGTSGSGAGTAGSRTAGAPSMPSAGSTSVPEEPEPPPNCTTESHFNSGKSSCAFEFSCDDGEARYSTKCEQNRVDGGWSCYCSTSTGEYKVLSIAGVEGADACSAAAAACVNDAPEDELTCELLNKSVSTDACTKNEVCGWDLELGSGATAHVGREYSASCTGSAGQFGCQCSVGTNYFEYQASAPSTNDLCDTVSDFCKSGEAPDFSAQETCVQQTVTVGVSGCDATETCSRAAEIGEGTALLLAVQRYGSCQAPVGGVSRCSCATENETFIFDAKLSAADHNACLSAAAGCASDTEIEPNGPIACSPILQNVTPRFCDAEFDCTQPVKFSGGEYTGHGRLLLACQQSAAGEPWSCSCASRESSKTFELEGAAAGWEACSEASTRCQEEIDVFIGPTGEITLPPPLP